MSENEFRFDLSRLTLLEVVETCETTGQHLEKHIDSISDKQIILVCRVRTLQEQQRQEAQECYNKARKRLNQLEINLTNYIYDNINYELKGIEGIEWF